MRVRFSRFIHSWKAASLSFHSLCEAGRLIYSIPQRAKASQPTLVTDSGISLCAHNIPVISRAAANNSDFFIVVGMLNFVKKYLHSYKIYFNDVSNGLRQSSAGTKRSFAVTTF